MMHGCAPQSGGLDSLGCHLGGGFCSGLDDLATSWFCYPRLFYCNATGKECYGTSVIVGPTGDPLVVLPTDREVFGIATLNLALNADWDRWRSRLDPVLLPVSGRDRPREP